MTDDIYEFDKGLDKLRAEAASIQSRIRDAQRTVDSDPNLSDQGRIEAMIDVRSSAQTRLDQLKVAEIKAIKDKTTSIERSVFGFASTDPSEIISRRDADDRADRIKEAKEAEALLERAERSGDTHLAQAVVRVAATKGYSSVLQAYEREHPATGPKLALLAQLQRSTEAGYLMKRNVAYSARLL